MTRVTALRAVVSLAFLVVAFAGVGVGRVGSALAQMDVLLLLAAVVVLGGSHLLASLRWWLIMRRLEVELTLGEAVRLFFVGLFFTNVLPSGFGGDAVRGWQAARRTGRSVEAGVSVLVDRVVAVWALVALGLVAALAVPGAVPHAAWVGAITSTAAVVAGSVVVFSVRTQQVLERVLHRRPRALDVVGRTGAALRGLAGHRRLLVLAFAISLASQACVSVAAWLLARGLGIDVSPALLTAAIPVALLATAVPTTINGLGVREAVFRALLVPAGVSASTAVAFSLMTVVAGALVSLPGALLWVAGRTAEKLPDAVGSRVV